MLKIILMVLGVMLISGGTVTGLYFSGLLSGDGDSADDEEAQSEEQAPAPAIYIPLDPPFVVNFASAGKAQFLQITMEVMTRSTEAQTHIVANMPAIRNALVLLFSSQSYQGISTLEGKEALREETLSVIRQVLSDEVVLPEPEDEEQPQLDIASLVEAVFFTSIVMQ